MCNYYASKWKREKIVDHNFDYVNIDEFRDGHWFTMFLYCFKVFLIIKSILIYAADIWTLLVLLEVVKTAFGFLTVNEYFKYVFLASIICSFLLLLWDLRKAYKIIKSRDIAFAFTDIISYNIYILKSYSYFCIFHRIDNLKNTRDIITFFVFFRLKRWKRILLAEAPRQIINGYTLVVKFIDFKRGSFDYSAFQVNITQQISIILIAVSFFLFVISALSVIIALILYVPLICQIQGNLKEYVCHKIDKRVGKMVTTKSKRRALENQRRQEHFNQHQSNHPHLKHLPKPTLPNVIIEEEIDYKNKFNSFKSTSTSSYKNNLHEDTFNNNQYELRHVKKNSFDFKGDSNSSISSHSNTIYDGRKSPSAQFNSFTRHTANRTQSPHPSEGTSSNHYLRPQSPNSFNYNNSRSNSPGFQFNSKQNKGSSGRNTKHL